MKSIRIKNLFVLLLVFIVSMGLLVGCSTSKKENQSFITTTLCADKTTLQISTPFKLKESNEHDLGGMEAYIKKDITKSAQKDGIMIMAVEFVFDKDKIEAETGQQFTPNIEGAVLRAVGNIKTLRSSSEVKEVVINGITGKEIEGTLDMKFDDNTGDSRYEFRTRAFGRGMEVWLVTVVYKPSDVNKRVSDAIFNSLKLS